jgi:hypothetical protein
MILVHWIRKVARFRIRQFVVQEALVFESKYIVSIELDGTKWYKRVIRVQIPPLAMMDLVAGNSCCVGRLWSFVTVSAVNVNSSRRR